MALRAAAVPLAQLESIQKRVLWLSAYLVHHANTRPNPDGTKVGGHQASASSVVSLMTALYFHALRPGDIVATKAHASPVFYAIEYLRGRLTADQLRGLRTLGGLQAYPSRRKNPEIVDLSTGSMGLGAVSAAFGALAARYVSQHLGGGPMPGRFIAMMGDAELDEGNVWEALLEEAVRELDNLMWVVDFNRQSLDRIVPDARRGQLREWFRGAGWHVIELRWGSRLRALFGRPGGERLRARLEGMGNAEYQSLLRLPPAGARKVVIATATGETDPAVDRLLADVSDETVVGLVADVGGHDLASILEAYEEAGRKRSGPCVILADTIKGWGYPFGGDPMNHSALVTQGQLDEMRAALGLESGAEWAGFAPGSAEAELIRRAPAPDAPPAPRDAGLDVPDALEDSYPAQSSTQEAFGRILGRLSRLPVGDRVVTLSADVSVTTHLAGWINRKGVYFPRAKPGFTAEGPQAVQWKESPAGQHIELGIAEHNLFLALGAFGLTAELSGATLLPIGTLYDPFVTRGLDALYHALYAGGRFIVAATPSGVSLSPEGGAHQSVITPGIGIALPAVVYYEPTFAQEVEWILLEGLRGLVRRGDAESLYLRLSTKPIEQALAPAASPAYRDAVLRGGYRLIDARERPGYDREGDAVHIFAAGVMVPEAVAASRALAAQGVLANVFVVTSPDLLHRGLRTTDPYVLDLVSADEEGVPVVSVLDGHSHGLAFLGGALGVPQIPLGVDHFGQSGSRGDLYRHYGVDAAAIARAANRLLARGSAPG
ncbi:MAG TPA: 1-deoxy-D-xylulose-5-phosphate synthase N-terminal domain-containing protein [Methylomirabilota bacterium]|nr:1-deoxy-D-xylulose-5-phosphate synthase N-terminal domain-containing protein [Methylomirabilota bacterium]